MSELNAQLEALENAGDDDGPEFTQLQDRYAEADQERDALASGTEVWPQEAKAKCGVLIWLDRYDGMRVACGRLKPGQKKGAAATAAAAPGADPSTTKPKPAKKPELSAAIVSALSAHRSAAAARAIAKDHVLATAVLIGRLLECHRGGHGHGAVRIDLRSARDHVQIAPDIDKASREPLQAASKALAAIPRKDTIAWLLKQPETFLQDTLATLVALSFDGITESPQGDPTATAIHAAVGIDMAKHWTPACDGFLTRVSGPILVAAVTEACGKEQASKVASAKGKEGRAAEAGKLLGGTGWLPKPLRGPGYKTGAVKSASKPVKAAAKKAPAKPAAKKATKAAPAVRVALTAALEKTP